jgi:DNA-3-methyladenine glycosylase
MIFGREMISGRQVSVNGGYCHMTHDIRPQYEPLTKEFYLQETTFVAKELLGKILEFRSGEQVFRGVINETEAYLGVKDKACHTFGWRKTPRVKSMYLEGGHAYVYQIYGLHFCLNVVTREEGNPEAVLIRGVVGLQGPGRLTKAFGITKIQDGWDLKTSKLRILEGDITSPFLVRKTARIGVDYAEEWASRKLRYLAVSL